MENEQNLINETTGKKATVSCFKLYKYAAPFDLLLICLGTMASVICGIMAPYIMVCVGDVTGEIIDYTFNITQNVLVERVVMNEKLFSETQKFATICSLAVVIIVFCSYATEVCFSYSALRQTLKMRKLFFGKVLDQDIEWHDQNPTGNFENISKDISKIEDAIGEKVGRIIYVQTIIFFSFYWAYVKGWKLALCCIILFPLKDIIHMITGLFVSKYHREETEAYRALGIVTGEILRAIRTVVAFGGEEKESKRYDDYIKQAQNKNVTRCFVNALHKAIHGILAYARFALAFWYGIGLVIDERSLPEEKRIYTPGNMIGIFFLSLLGTSHFGIGGLYILVVQTAKSAAYKVYKILDSEPGNHNHDVRRLPNFTSDIVFDHVNFSYQAEPDMPVLNDITMKIEFGDMIAIVGPPDSGKSTLVQLLRKFLHPTSGTITIDGIDLKDIDESYLGKNISVISGDPSLFATTIENNILYGNLSATKDDIVDAARDVDVHKFISILPNGYQTIIDSEIQLSKDQKIRIALAKALVKKPFLFIFDDVTSLLDRDKEVKIQATLDEISEGCTKIVITNKLSTIRNATRIIVLDKGSIIEQGSHQDLIALKGVYYNMLNSKEDTELNEEDYFKLSETKPFFFMSYGENVEEEVGEESKNISNELSKQLYVKILQFCRPEWLQMVMGCLASLIKGASLPLYGLILGNIFGVLSTSDNIALKMKANFYCLEFLYLGIATGIAVFFQLFTFDYADVQIKNRMRTQMFTTMLKQDIGWFDRKENHGGVLRNNLAYDPLTVQSAGRIGLALNSFSTLFLSVMIGFYLEWRLTLIAGVFYPLIFCAILYERKHIKTDADFKQKTLEESSKFAVESIVNIGSVKALGSENTIYESYIKKLESSKTIRFKRSLMTALLLGCLRSLQFLPFAWGIYYGAEILSRGEVDSATIFQVLELTITIACSIGNTWPYSPDMQKVTAAATRMFALSERVPAVKNHGNSIQHQWENTNIKFSKIYFSDPINSSVQILNDFDLSIQHGETKEIFGGSLCGKSIVLELLLRFYDPPCGAISIDGEDIRNLDLHSLRSQMGIVSRKSDFFDLTIAENISYGVNDRTVSMEEIIEAAKSANIHDYIASLSLGYETRFSLIEKALLESQKQRIAIARALLRNPKILLLDEVTSALDDESAKVVLEVLDKATQGRTCILVSRTSPGNS